jgi:hypothetical protein
MHGPRVSALATGILLAVSAIWATEAAAQLGGFLGQQAVGGVSIDANGVISNTRPDTLNNLRDARKRALKQVPGELNAANNLRKISLRQLQATLLDLRKQFAPIPNELRLLGGLQRIEYVFVYPEEKDIVLAGFGEGWRVDERGSIVGITTGRPVVLLEDLLVALRTAERAGRGGISCSIDPTQDGMRRLQEYVSTLTTIGNADNTVSTIEQRLGPQTITLQGVPPTSHFAQVMVAADYRMKRIAMKFELSPLKGLPSYLEMVSVGGRGMNNMQPRWWLATHYDPLLTDADGLSWQLRGPGVKTMTEDAYFAANGQRVVQAGKTSPAAQKWADIMTEKYDQLSLRAPIFGDLRNCMDLAVVSALIFKEQLARKADLDLTPLLSDVQLPVDEYPIPKQTDSKCSFVKKSGNWVISVSGGVQMDPWAVIEQKEQTEILDSLRHKALPGKNSAASEHWWSN